MGNIEEEASNRCLKAFKTNTKYSSGRLLVGIIPIGIEIIH